jgi:hypothetical protein
MGTRSAIGVMHGDKAKVVYCHSDGYIDHNGRILQEHYNSAKANHLVALGDLSSLDSEVEIPEGTTHSFDDPQKGITIFYGRDRGESGCEFKVIHSDKELFETYDWCEYFYLMRNGVWLVSRGSTGGWKLLSDAIRELDDKTFKAPIFAESPQLLDNTNE